jgi:hypothetical protein
MTAPQLARVSKVGLQASPAHKVWTVLLCFLITAVLVLVGILLLGITYTCGFQGTLTFDSENNWNCKAVEDYSAQEMQNFKHLISGFGIVLALMVVAVLSFLVCVVRTRKVVPRGGQDETHTIIHYGAEAGYCQAHLLVEAERIMHTQRGVHGSSPETHNG